MSNEITAYFKEFNELDAEVKIRSDELKKLRSRQKELSEKLKAFLIETKRPGVKIPQSEKAIILEERQSRKAPTKEEKGKAIETVLSHYGIRNGTKLLEELDEARRGPETTVSRIKTIKVNSGMAIIPKK